MHAKRGFMLTSCYMLMLVIRTWWEALPVSSPQGEARNPKQLAETRQGAGPVGGSVFTTSDT